MTGLSKTERGPLQGPILATRGPERQAPNYERLRRINPQPRRAPGTRMSACCYISAWKWRDSGREMLRIGYVRFRDRDPAAETATLKALGCQVVRAEDCQLADGDEFAVLLSILDFVGAGDQLVVTRLDSLGASARAILEVLDRLEQRGALLIVAEPD